MTASVCVLRLCHAAGCLIALAVLTAAASTRVIQPETPLAEGNQMMGAGGGRGGVWKPPLPFYSSQDEADDTCIYPFCVWVVVFPGTQRCQRQRQSDGRDLPSRCQIFPQDGGVFEIYYIAQWTQFEGRSGFFPLSDTNNVRHWFYMFNFFKSSLSRIATISIQKSCSSVLPPSRRKSFDLVSRVRLSSHFPSSGQLPLKASEEDGED